MTSNRIVGDEVPDKTSADSNLVPEAAVGERDSASGRMSIFHLSDAVPFKETDMMSRPTFPEATEAFIDDYDFSALAAGSDLRVLFRQGGDDGPSLVYAWFAPGLILPSHSHSADCLYYVVSGQALLGKRVISAGEGFFVPAGTPYRYRAGADGVEILEFRHARSFDMQIFESKRSRWDEVFEVAYARRDAWEAMPRPRGQL